MVEPVQARRGAPQANPGGRDSETRARARLRAKPPMPRFQEKPLSFRPREAVPETDTGGQGEKPQALGRTRVKELGKMAP